MLSVCVLVSGGGTNLQAILNAQKAGKITAGKVTQVISSSESAYALTRAKEAGIPATVVARGEGFTNRLLAALEQCKPDLIVLAGFMCILAPEVIRAYPNRIINVHPSLIPAFCGDGYYGIHVHERALEYGVKVSGATVHFVNEVTDGGAIILQKAVEVLADDTPETLQKRIMQQAEWVILPEAIEHFCLGEIEVREGRTTRIRRKS